MDKLLYSEYSGGRNFIGESIDISSQKGLEQKFKYLRTIYIVAVSILLLGGLVCSYSASFPVALSEGHVHYYYLLKQFLYVCLGLLVGAFFYFLPETLFKIIIPIYMFACFVVLGLNLFVKNSLITYEVFFSLIILAVVLYFSLYFSNRKNKISRLRELMFPTLFSVCFVFFITIMHDTTYLIVFIATIIVLFAIGGVSTGGIVLLFLYSIVPSICWIASDPVKLQSLLNKVIPGLNSSEEALQAILRKQCISGSSWFGKGLGMGTYKFENFHNISSDYIICNIIDEHGVFGIITLIILFGLFSYTGYRCSYYIKKYSYLYSNLSASLTTVIVWHFLINLFTVFEIIPFQGISLPFFSVRTNITITVVEVFLILRCLRKENISENKSESLVLKDYYEETN